jgi:hypothetical protein
VQETSVPVPSTTGCFGEGEEKRGYDDCLRADAPAATISDRVRRGELVRLARGVYTRDASSDPAAVVAREWHDIAGRMFPDAGITDRSALTGGPVGGVLYLARDGRARSVDLPGLRVTARPGAGPLDGDIPLPGGLHQASKGPARSARGRSRRTPFRRTRLRVPRWRGSTPASPGRTKPWTGLGPSFGPGRSLAPPLNEP